MITSESPYACLILITKDEYMKLTKTEPSTIHPYRLQVVQEQEKSALDRCKEENNTIPHENEKNNTVLQDNIKVITSTFPKTLISKAILLLSHLVENKMEKFENLIDLIRHTVSESRPNLVPSNWTQFSKLLLETNVPTSIVSTTVSNELGLRKKRQGLRTLNKKRRITWIES